MDVVLIAGLWLPVSVWDEVVHELERLGHRARPVALPGVDDGSASAALDDQVAAVLAVVDRSERPLVVGHSAACTIAWIAADRRPEQIAGLAMVGGFPGSDGDRYAEFFDLVDGVMPFPGWEAFEGRDSADLDQSQRHRFAAAAVPVPEGVASGVVRLADERRFQVPVCMVCPEFSPDEAKEWIASGDVPELASASDLSFVDIDSGHWPMLTQPHELAKLLDGVARAFG